MSSTSSGHPPGYLVIGHVSKDLTPQGPVLGGSAAYAGLTAAALGMHPALVTSAGPDLDISPLASVSLVLVPSPSSTSYENQYTLHGRRQVLRSRARDLALIAVPPEWRSAPIIHLAPIADEVDPSLAGAFPGSFVGVSAQGWLRQWDQEGNVQPKNWVGIKQWLPLPDAVVVSLEDLGDDEMAAASMSAHCRILAVTEGAAGAVIYWNGDVRRVPAPQANEEDSTGSGDIFAAAFFIHLHRTRDPWEAARFANYLAALSVPRKGIAAVPTPEEAGRAQWEVIP